MAKEIAVKLQEIGIMTDVDDGSSSSIIHDYNLIIVLGGDGTILRAAREYAPREIPILGVNMGRVGFLSDIKINEFKHYIERIVNGDYKLDPRVMMEVIILKNNEEKEKYHCLNEIVIRSKYPRIQQIDVKIQGLNAGSYLGDGLIIATPTGSTGYSLSAGGPIIEPDLEVFILTPIASHLITKRPVLVGADKEIILKPIDYSDTSICLDGQVHINLQQDDVIKIRQANFKVKLIKLKDVPFFSTIDSRLRSSELFNNE